VFIWLFVIVLFATPENQLSVGEGEEDIHTSDSALQGIHFMYFVTNQSD
jgi:hypothetical protein